MSGDPSSWDSVPIGYINSELRELYYGPAALVPRPVARTAVQQQRDDEVVAAVPSDRWVNAVQVQEILGLSQAANVRTRLTRLWREGRVSRRSTPRGDGYGRIFVYQRKV